MILETERLILRDLEWSDLFDLSLMLVDPEVRTFASRGPLTQDQIEELLNSYMSEASQYGFGVCAIIRKEKNDLIGYCGLERHLIDGKIGIELVYCLARAFWNQGFAFDAAHAIKKYVMETLKISPLFSFINPGNTRSIRLAEKLGGRANGTIRIHHIEKLAYIYEK